MSYPLRMQHPAHGWHHAYNQADEANLKANGWTDAAPQSEPPLIAVATVAGSDGVAPEPKKRGRPPKAKQ